MLRFAIFLLIPFFIADCWCQVNFDSLVGKYSNKSWIGGGFTGGPNGECISLPPDYSIDNRITIDSNLMVTKISDTTKQDGMLTSFLDKDSDIVYRGKATITGDTVIVTYDMKQIAPDLSFYIDPTVQLETYEILDRLIVEKYIVWREEGKILGLIHWEHGWKKDYYKEADSD